LSLADFHYAPSHSRPDIPLRVYRPVSRFHSVGSLLVTHSLASRIGVGHFRQNFCQSSLRRGLSPVSYQLECMHYFPPSRIPMPPISAKPRQDELSGFFRDVSLEDRSLGRLTFSFSSSRSYMCSGFVQSRALREAE